MRLGLEDEILTCCQVLELLELCWGEFLILLRGLLTGCRSHSQSTLVLTVFSGFSGRSPVCSCHMLDFTQTGFGNSPMTLSQSPLKPDYPNQLSCLLEENLALESVFYKDTNHRTKKSINFFLNRLDLPDKKGPNHIIILV